MEARLFLINYLTMAFLEIQNVDFRGVATAVPKQIKVAKEQPFFTDIEAENFTNVTGVISSHVAPAEMTLSDLCLVAAENLFEASGWERESIDLIIFVFLPFSVPLNHFQFFSFQKIMLYIQN